MTKETFKQDIKTATAKLLEMVGDACWNKVSKDCLYIISEIDDDTDLNFDEQRVLRKRNNDLKCPLSFENVMNELEKMYYNLYDINIYVYHAKKDITIIEIQYYPKSFVEISYRSKIKDNDPMLHCKIGIPPYRKDESEKYDVNWELGGIRHRWNMYWWRKIMSKKHQG